MAVSSPIPNNKIVDSMIAIATGNGNNTTQRSTIFGTPKQNLRGLNKPKCIKCGNVARSRCPFQSCKNCCAKAENPCHIHVLKPTSTLPDKPPTSNTPLIEQPPTDVPSTGASWRLSSLRQLSSNFASSLRAKKPLTRKDAVNINKWRFSKLRENIRGSIEAENEAFDRYLGNVSLLEEVFSIEGNKPPEDENNKELVSEIKAKLKSNAETADGFRERLRNLVNRKLRELEHVNGDDEADASRELKRAKKVEEWRDERTSAVNDLVDKLSKVRSEDDLKSCLETKLHLFNPCGIETEAVDLSDLDSEDQLSSEDSTPALSYSRPEICTIVPVDEAALRDINLEFSSLNEIAEL